MFQEPLNSDANQRIIGIIGFQELNFLKRRQCMRTMLISLLIFSFLSRKKKMSKKMMLNSKKISYMKSCTSLERTSSKQQGLTKIQLCPNISPRWEALAVDLMVRAWFPTRNWEVRSEVQFLCQASKVRLIVKVDLVISKTSTSDRNKKIWFRPKIYRRRLSICIMLL